MSDGSDGPSRRPRRSNAVIASSSSSESEDDIPLATRRKRMRVMSEADSESSDSSSIVYRRRRLPVLRDSASGGSECDVSPTVPRPASASGSDSSEGNSDKCSICLLRFKDQVVGIPETCEHVFCLDCITEWSRNVNTCPVDRITFEAIVVRACAGGRVLRVAPVKVVPRRPSVDSMVVEDPTNCELCGDPGDEDHMLICDNCDLGFHMQCLTPPLAEVPEDQWYCPNCHDLIDVIGQDLAELNELDDFFNEFEEISGLLNEPRPSLYRYRRSNRQRALAREVQMAMASAPSTSNGNTNATTAAPSTSRSPRSTVGRTAAGTTRRRAPRRRRRTRAHTVVTEYEIQAGGKFPVKRTVKRTIKRKPRRRTRRAAPRTAARRAHVRASVRAQLAALRNDATDCATSVTELNVRRTRAGIPSLSLFGSAFSLEPCSDEEYSVGDTAVARAQRPTTSQVQAYRQARRKMVSLPSPQHTSSASDLLDSIMESQELLHNKRSVASVTVDGTVSITLTKRLVVDGDPAPLTKDCMRPNMTADATESARKVYGGHHGGGGGQRGGWGGGYRGRYPPPHPADTTHRGNNWSPGGGAEPRFGRGGHEPPAAYGRQPPPDAPYQPLRRLPHPFRPYQQREQQQPLRRPPPPFRLYQQRDLQRPPEQSHPYQQEQLPIDMRTVPPTFPAYSDSHQNNQDQNQEENLVIDTDKYDPTEPTDDDGANEDDSPSPCEEDRHSSDPLPLPPEPPIMPLAPPPEPPIMPLIPPPDPPIMPLAPPPEPPIIGDSSLQASLLAGCVRAAMDEHRLSQPQRPQSDEDSEGDCPNFSIYSATSVHIANTGSLTAPYSDYNQRLAKRCPITPTARAPIKIKLNTNSLLKRASLYDEEDSEIAETADDHPSTPPVTPPVDDNVQLNASPKVVSNDSTPTKDEPSEEEIEGKLSRPDSSMTSSLYDALPPSNDDEMQSPKVVSNDSTPTKDEPSAKETAMDDLTDAESNHEDEEKTPSETETSIPAKATKKDKPSDEERDDKAEELELEDNEDINGSKSDIDSINSHAARATSAATNDDALEAISEAEDDLNERSYTPCLDERKTTSSPGASPVLGTEIISDGEPNHIFSDDNSPSRSISKSKSPSKSKSRSKSPVQKKKKEPKKDKENKEKVKTKGKKDVAFKKLSKSGKERNYRDRDKDDKDKDKDKKRRDRRESAERRRRKERRQDLLRYDVRSVLNEKRRPAKDAFGRDLSPPINSPSPRRSMPRKSVSPRRRSMSHNRRKSMSPRRRSMSPMRRKSISPRRRSKSPLRRKSISPRSGTPIRRKSKSPRRRSKSSLRRKSISPRRRSGTPLRRKSISPRRRSISPRRRSITPRRRSITPRKRTVSPRRRSITPPHRTSVIRRRSRSPIRRKSLTPRKRISIPHKRTVSPRSPRRKSISPRRRKPPSVSPSPRKKSPGRKRKRSTSPKPKKKKKRVLSKRKSPKRKSPKRKRKRSQVVSPPPQWSPSVDSNLLSPRTPPAVSPVRRRYHAPPQKEVFTSGDNILVSVSFKEQQADGVNERRARKEAKRSRRRRRAAASAAAAPAAAGKPVAIIDLDRSPFREMTPSPKNVIVLSDSDHGEKEAPAPERAKPAPEPTTAPEQPERNPVTPVGPKTPPTPALNPQPAAAPPAQPSPDAYDPFEPTRSPTPVRDPPSEAHPTHMTLETAQKTNLSADEVLDRRPLSPIEKVMALLQSIDEAPEVGARSPPAAAPPPAAPVAQQQAVAPRVVLPHPQQPPKLFLAKPSPIKSNPVKPMVATKVATKLSRLPLPPACDSPYSPGSSDFGDLFSPPTPPQQAPGTFDALFDKPPRRKGHTAKVPVKISKKRGNKKEVGVLIDDDNLKIMDDLPSSAVEMQVKSKFLKKLNRQERVVEEVKHVLKPHYNKKRVTKEEYKDILRRAVPKICHNKSGEINPAKIQALVEAYVKKIRKRHKLGLA